MNKEIFSIPSYKMEELEKKLTRIKNKCKKYGNEYIFEILGTEVKEIINPDNNIKYNIEFTNVKISGNTIINNWEFIATLEHTEKGNIIKQYNTSVTVPEYYMESDCYCDHCKTKRNRNNLYIIRNVETNEYKQVGRSCLKDYTQGLSAEYVGSIIECMDLFASYEDLKDNYNGLHFHSMKKLETYLKYANLLTKKIGYMSTKSDISTKYLVYDLVNNDKYIYERIREKFQIELSEADFDTDENKQEVHNIIEYFKSCDPKNDTFMNNLKIISNMEYTKEKNLGFIACMPNTYYKAIEKELEIETKKRQQQEIKEKQKESSFFGEIGKRYKMEGNYNITCVGGFDTQYNYTWIYHIIDNNTNDLFVWFTSGSLDETKSDYVKFDFTIKDHREYNGIKQNIVTRCKLS